MLDLSEDAGWAGTGDPIMAVKLAGAVWGDEAPSRFRLVMWRLLAELDVPQSGWVEIFEAAQKVQPGLGPKRTASPSRTPAQLLARVKEILKTLPWHESIPFRLLNWAIAEDFTRFHHEVNDTHLKAHFCDIIRDGLPPVPFDGQALARDYPWMAAQAREIEETQSWDRLPLLADHWETQGLVAPDHPHFPMIMAAIEHARQGGHGPGCWLTHAFSTDPLSPLPRFSIDPKPE